MTPKISCPHCNKEFQMEGGLSTHLKKVGKRFYMDTFKVKRRSTTKKRKGKKEKGYSNEHRDSDTRM